MSIEINLSGYEKNSTEPVRDEELFSWAKQWYPVAVVDYLDPSRPHGIELLGKNLVLWRDGSQKWRCFDDFCPHRLAPLSEGRVESDGTLMCAYHAWRFDSHGKCVSIPQTENKQLEAKHCQNSKSWATSYPTQERQGLLWVWAESGNQAQLESQLRSPRIIPELEDNSGKVVKLYWYIRDLPYGWDSFMENVADPAHVPVSHHGIMGSRYEDAKYYDMIRVKEISTQEGFSFGITPTTANVKQAIHDFQPPCHMKITSDFVDGGKFILALYASPTKPGWCRHIGCQVLVKNDRGKIPKGLAFFALPMPTWLGHILASLFLHQDLVFLHYQEKIVAQRCPDDWLDGVYTPNPQDKMIITFRKWLHKRAGGGVAWAEGVTGELPPPERDKQKLFDVWTTHTKDCQVCQNALKNINRATIFLYAAAIACFGFGVVLDARATALKATFDNSASILTIAPSGGFWWALVGSILLATLGYQLKRLSRLFYVYEFNHSHND